MMCARCKNQLKISRTEFVDIFYACRIHLNLYEGDDIEGIDNCSGKVEQVIKTGTCSDFQKSSRICQKVEAWLIDDLTDDDL